MLLVGEHNKGVIMNAIEFLNNVDVVRLNNRFGALLAGHVSHFANELIYRVNESASLNRSQQSRLLNDMVDLDKAGQLGGVVALQQFATFINSCCA
ncbi:MAG: hypothetical protein V4436_02730 [Patescibacteria group bacterium]